MSNFATIISVIAQVLADDDTLNALVDGQIVPGFRRSMSDQYLTGANQACVGVRSLSDNSQGLPGCYYHGESTHDHLIEIRIITKLTTERQSDTYAAAIAARVESLLKAGITKTMNGTSYELPYVGNINFTPLDDDLMNDRIEVQATFRVKYYG